ncbi:MAG: SBBP repeat-containing protein [Ignavibacteria bacterium]|nr:SBBP repeat-containing protein [Ignavibacteria bacterium]
MFRQCTILIAFVLFASTVSTWAQSSAALTTKPNMPVTFVENKGQWPSQVRFLGQTRGMNVWLTEKGLTYDVFSKRAATSAEIKSEKSRLRKISSTLATTFKSEKSAHITGQVITMELVGANHSQTIGDGEQNGYRNYFIGSDPTAWRSNVPAYTRLISKEVYPGVDAIYTFQDGKPRYDFIVKPGANPASIAIRFNGANAVSVTEDKGVKLSTVLGAVYNGHIYAYQNLNGREVKVNCSFVKNGENVQFNVGNYDRNQPLVIDPIVYASYFGGSGNDDITGMAFDKVGNVVITGVTDSPNYPIKIGSYDTLAHGGTDAFAAKFDPTLTRLLFSSFIGGGSDDKSNGVAVNIFDDKITIAGETSSSNMPKPGGYKLDYSQGIDGFVTRFSADGKTLDFFSYLGGTGDDYGLAVAVDNLGSAVVGGKTKSSNFSGASAQSYQKLNGGQFDGFIFKLSTTGGSLEFSTYLGGGGNDEINAVAAYGEETFVAGTTGSGLQKTFPVPPPGSWGGPSPDPDRIAYKSVFNSGAFSDGFVGRFNKAGGLSQWEVEYLTYIGANKNETVRAITVLDDGSAVIAGETNSTDYVKGFPSSNTSIQFKGGATDIYVSKLSPNGRLLKSSIMFGGSGADSVSAISFSTGTNEIYVVGKTTSIDFQMSQLSPPLAAEFPDFKGPTDAYVAKLPSGLGNINYATYYGGTGQDGATAVAVSKRGDAYFAGTTSTTDLMAYTDEFQPSLSGGRDGFIAKVAFGFISITSPNGGNLFCPDGNMNIQWDKRDGLQYNVPADVVDIELSSDNGLTWSKKITTNVTTPSYVWHIPKDQAPGTTYKVRVYHIASGIRDESDQSFTIGVPVQITESPVSDSVCPGTRVRFKVKGTGANLTYQWNFNGNKIPNANSDSLVITSAQNANGGNYTCDVSAGCQPATSQAATLVVKPKPQVQVQPTGGKVTEGSAITLKVVALGRNLTYEWRQDGFKIGGAEGPEYVISGANGGNNGMYKVIIRGECGIDSSIAVKVEVVPASVDEPNLPGGVHFVLRSPIPANDNVQATITSPALCPLSVTLNDNLGQPVANVFNGTLDANVAQPLSVNVNNLSSGIYWLSAKCGTQWFVQKVEIIH